MSGKAPIIDQAPGDKAPDDRAPDDKAAGGRSAIGRIPMAERILATADRLFYQRGIRAVGVDMVAAEAGISKRSLYDSFPSKEALIEAYLLRRWAPLPADGAPPRAQVLAVFDRLAERFADPGFRGCPFVNAVAELGESCAAAQGIALRFKQQRRDWLRDRLVEAGARDAETLATQVALLVEGAIASMLVHHDPAVVDTARSAAEVLLDAGLTPPAAPPPGAGR